MEAESPVRKLSSLQRQQSQRLKRSKVKLGVPGALLEPLQHLISTGTSQDGDISTQRFVPKRLGKAASLPVDLV
jgi:hypothetical protein